MKQKNKEEKPLIEDKRKVKQGLKERSEREAAHSNCHGGEIKVVKGDPDFDFKLFFLY